MSKAAVMTHNRPCHTDIRREPLRFKLDITNLLRAHRMREAALADPVELVGIRWNFRRIRVTSAFRWIICRDACRDPGGRGAATGPFDLQRPQHGVHSHSAD